MNLVKGVLRFRTNAIVRFLLDAGPFDLNKLALIPFSDRDREQFAQLIGYSVDGFLDLSYVREKTREKVEARMWEKLKAAPRDAGGREGTDG